MVAGNFMNTKGAIEPLTPLLTVRFEFDEGAEYEFEVPETFNTILYQLTQNSSESFARTRLWNHALALDDSS